MSKKLMLIALVLIISIFTLSACDLIAKIHGLGGEGQGQTPAAIRLPRSPKHPTSLKLPMSLKLPTSPSILTNSLTVNASAVRKILTMNHPRRSPRCLILQQYTL